ncbi:oligosaccharide flippase family protein [Lichenihabitans sp. Uapishka_5]|uniref:oligosaccharide flippase family protein n=1 Tax=Lichenihabitans sp. Uapishka_5 TaxID=3037302 RepID=UPI0029E7D6B2|nr:oligosaccharide flippase family protein [Lichenihabitans sp. Uapishka_5]MDX7950244.1 oligosaccharide flippase family protein [Lichenihabitans sp. Uapishka_5]
MLWLLGQNGAARLLQSCTQVVLAWLLSPADFGQISLALTVSSLVSALFQLGLDDVLMQRTKAMRLWYATAFWLSLLASLASAATLLAIAPAVASVYGEPDLLWLIACLALASPLAALSTVPNAVIRARLAMRSQTILVCGEIVASSLCSIALATAHFGVYSFVLALPFVAALRSLAAWRMAGLSPFAGRRFRRWRVLLPSASAVLLTRLLNLLVGQGDYIVFGLTATASQVGLYYFAFRIAGQPMRLLAGSVTSILLPTLVHLDPVQQGRAALMVARIMAIVVMPACFLQAALAGPLLHLFFGERWQSAKIFIQILSVSLAFDAVSWVVGSLMPARGEFLRALHYVAATAVAFFVLVVAGSLLNPDYGVPVAVSGYYVLVQPAYSLVVFRRVTRISLRVFTGIYAAPVLLSGAIVFGTTLLVEDRASDALKLLLLPGIVLPAYALCIRHVLPEPCRHVVERLKTLRRGS